MSKLRPREVIEFAEGILLIRDNAKIPTLVTDCRDTLLNLTYRRVAALNSQLPCPGCQALGRVVSRKFQTRVH